MTKTVTAAAVAIPEVDFALPSQQVATVETPAAPLPALPPQEATILGIIERASRDPNVDIDKMERLIGMQERIQTKQAQIEFDNAMAEAQEAMKAIRTDAANTQTKSKYATYAALDLATRPIYSRHGFALSFNTGDAPNPNEVRVLCTVSHRAGHRQDYKIDMPADGKGPQGAAVMTRTHATGAAASYGQRYLLKLIFNLAVGDVDDDGNGAMGSWGAGGKQGAVDEAAADGLIQGGDQRSTYRRTADAKNDRWCEDAIVYCNSVNNKEDLVAWWKKNAAKREEIEGKHPEDYRKFIRVYDLTMDGFNARR